MGNGSQWWEVAGSRYQGLKHQVEGTETKRSTQKFSIMVLLLLQRGGLRSVLCDVCQL